MNNNKVLSSLIWKILERGGTQVTQFVIQIILARLLLPEDYGIVAIVTVFISLANVFVQSGFNTALIQKKEVDDTDYSSVFYLSLFVSFVLYIIIFIIAPFIATFYKNQLLTPVLRVLSLTLFFGAINSIQNAVIARNMDFKKNFFSSFIAIVLSGVTGIALAFCGFGIWSLVVQQLLNMVFVTFILFFIIKWKPKLLFSWIRLKSLFSYGWKLLCSSLLDTLYRNIYELIIGKKYTEADLAYYNRGRQFPSLIVENINGSISTVLLPTMSSVQDEKNRVKEMTRKSIKMSSYIMFPMMIGLAIVARPLVSVILTDKWLPCVPFLQLLSISYMFWPIHTANLQAINAIGRSDIFLKLEIAKKIIGIIVIIITVRINIYAMAVGQIITGVTSSFINAYPNKKLLNYGYFEQIKDVLPSIFASLFMSLPVMAVPFFGLGNLTSLILQCIIGIVAYVGISYLFKIDSLDYIVKKVKGILTHE